LPITKRMTKKMIISAMKVPFGIRKLFVFAGVAEGDGLAAVMKVGTLAPTYLPRTKTNMAMKAKLMKYIASTRPTVRKKIGMSRGCDSG
jgi:hypothetical protein